MSEIHLDKLRAWVRHFGVTVSVGLNKDAPYHCHDTLQICYVKDGSAELLLGDRTVRLSKGDYYVVDLNQGHRYSEVSGSFPQFCIRFLPSAFWEGFSDDAGADEVISALCGNGDGAIRSVSGRIFRDKNENILRRFRSIRREWEKRLPGWQRIVGGELAAILLTMARTAEEEPPNRSGTSFVDTIIRYVEAHYAEPIALEQLCRMCNYTISYVSRVFRESTGQTFSDFLLEYRVRMACELLENGNMTVARVGRAVGYSNTSFFYRTFKSYTGMTPKDWRVAHRKETEGGDGE